MASSTGIKRGASHLASPDAKKAKTNSSITSFFGVPKAKSAASISVTSGSKFNKEKWVASLTPEQKELLHLEIETLHESWLAHLKDEVITPEFLDLKRFLKKEKGAGIKVFPPEDDIYSWSRYTPLNTVKAVILGQDPYHNHNQAHGLAFSVRPPIPAPPSLVNIYTAIKNDYPSFQAPANKAGLLTPWAERGVLMLNTCLTVRAHNANSHSNKGWERFTQKAIDTVAKVRTRGVVFLAWGKPAGKRVAGVDQKKHLVLQSVHPSPLSASRGWFDCGHFKKCNEWLAERYGEEEIIDWALTAKTTTIPALASIAANTVSIKKTEASSAEESKEQEGTSAIKTAQPIKPSADDEFEDDFAAEDLDALEALASAETETTPAKSQ
ncbi:hypothetical protein ASPZODRAFT_136540 [Penicilliopsis zonata CBS 506.65]|uniref:Uracil-DNA glycosylase n=1 Tax=Penicilliopsis zonata CBS 506.65 TaxID=1073090 RepID=A0A1L9S820_9EURO|nr:hypothetical protein ASPZODRAFT_136540 [Penicilliopsis zonata CBS 506.65]OJJ43314.1 hypothetical protein ASPZODRAFT_136540 [Penicilliopsis zonata CBS 506.65]